MKISGDKMLRKRVIILINQIVQAVQSECRQLTSKIDVLCISLVMQ